MSIPLKTDKLFQTIGKSVKSSNGEYLGQIAKVLPDNGGSNGEYLILKSDGFLGKGERRFAIPASTAFIKLTESKSVILQLSKEALHFVKRIAKDKSANPELKKDPLLYELI